MGSSLVSLPAFSEHALYLGDALLVAPVEGPLLDPLDAKHAGCGQQPQVLAGGRRADTELFG
jgi:hypothetical protein